MRIDCYDLNWIRTLQRSVFVSDWGVRDRPFKGEFRAFQDSNFFSSSFSTDRREIRLIGDSKARLRWNLNLCLPFPSWCGYRGQCGRSSCSSPCGDDNPSDQREPPCTGHGTDARHRYRPPFADPCASCGAACACANGRWHLTKQSTISTWWRQISISNLWQVIRRKAIDWSALDSL